jgi:hypothetical protein
MELQLSFGSLDCSFPRLSSLVFFKTTLENIKLLLTELVLILLLKQKSLPPKLLANLMKAALFMDSFLKDPSGIQLKVSLFSPNPKNSIPK